MFKGVKISEADRLFSLAIRSRANWQCERCGAPHPRPTTSLHCSHYHGRGKKSTRWDLENAAALCFGCHQYFTAHPLLHTDWFKQRLGERKFDLLTLRANIPAKMDESLVRIEMRYFLKNIGVDLKTPKGD